MLAHKIKPRPGLMRHLDWTNGLIDRNGRFTTYGRKNDVDGLDLADERKRVARIMSALAAAEDPKCVDTDEAMESVPLRRFRLKNLFRRKTDA